MSEQVFGSPLRRAKRFGKRRKQQRLQRVESSSILRLPRMSVPRTARRRRRRNSRSWQLTTAAVRRFVLSARWISLLLLILSIGSLAFVGMDSSFYLTMIPVEGVASIPPSEIVNASGLAGAHIFAASPERAASAIGEMPGVVSATVQLEWPSAAHISIQEDSPVAVWVQDGVQYWVNDEGHLVPARVEVPGLLHIEAAADALPTSQAAGEADSSEENPEADEDAVAEESAQPTESAPEAPLFVPKPILDGALQLRELRPNIDVLGYETAGGLSYQDGRGWIAYFGTGADMSQKLVIYETLVEELVAKGVSPAYISVTHKEAPYYMAN